MLCSQQHTYNMNNNVEYGGCYHSIHGNSPTKQADDLELRKLGELIPRRKDGNVEQVINKSEPYKPPIFVKSEQNYDTVDNHDNESDYGIVRSAGLGSATQQHTTFSVTTNDAARQLILDTSALDINMRQEVIQRRPDPILPGGGRVDYTVQANRLASFVGYWHGHMPVGMAELAAAGLYYTGPGDRVQCVFCRGGLYNWELGDTAFNEHKTHFPLCPFVMDHVSSETESRELPQNISNIRNEANTRPPHHNQGNSIKRYINAQSIAQKLGFSDDRISQAMGILKQNMRDEDITSPDLISAIHALEETAIAITETVQSKPSKPQDDQQEEAQLETENSQSVLKSHDRKSDTYPASLATKEIQRLAEENSKLKEGTKCKICLDEDAHMLFLPCRHLVCCEGCSDGVKNCVVCRENIIATIKTYLS